MRGTAFFKGSSQEAAPEEEEGVEGGLAGAAAGGSPRKGRFGMRRPFARVRYMDAEPGRGACRAGSALLFDAMSAILIKYNRESHFLRKDGGQFGAKAHVSHQSERVS